MAEVADAALPVFPFRINWKQGLSERLEWKTNVLPDFLGNEQRAAMRLTPRREFEATLTLWDQERVFWDLWLHRMGDTEFLFPLWHDSVRIVQDAPGGLKTIWVDTRDLEFRIGSYALLRGLTGLIYERVLISQVFEDRIVASTNLVSRWPKGSRIEPLVRGRMTDQTQVKPVTTRSSESTAVFETTHEQSYSAGVDSWDQYQGLPVLARQPNRSESLDASFQWSYSSSDSMTGRSYRRSDSKRALVQQKHAWLLHGRTAKAAFRSLLYRLRGAAGAIWLPTFNDDLVLSRNAAVAAGSIYVKTVGYAYTGGPTSGREYVCIQRRDGTRLYRRVTGTAASGSLSEERLTLDTPLPAGLLMADVSRISFMDIARFANDRIELAHVNAADGASTVAGVFQTFRNERQAPAVLSLPIPVAVKTAGQCDENAPRFEGWYYRLHYRIEDRNGNAVPNNQTRNFGFNDSRNPILIQGDAPNFAPPNQYFGPRGLQIDITGTTGDFFIYVYEDLPRPANWFLQTQGGFNLPYFPIGTLSMRRWSDNIDTVIYSFEVGGLFPTVFNWKF